MGTVSYSTDEHVAIVTLDFGENRFNPEFINTFLETLDAIEQRTAATALVVTSAHEKVFCNGIDLEWLAPVIQKGEIQAAKEYFYLLNRLFKRTLLSPLLTVAAISGHAFAGGAIWCCAFDFRFMRSDRGFFCFPEVDLGIPFLPGMLGLLKKAIPMYKLEEMQYTGRRLTAEECAEHHIISRACEQSALLPQALSFAKGLDKKREIICQMKLRLYKDIIAQLEVEDLAYIESGKFNIA